MDMRLLRHRTPTTPAPARCAQAPPAPAQAGPAAAAPHAEPCTDTGRDERRLRAAGGPEDHATYACRCGAVFPATPTTSVSCPLCGVHQAW